MSLKTSPADLIGEHINIIVSFLNEIITKGIQKRPTRNITVPDCYCTLLDINDTLHSLETKTL